MSHVAAETFDDTLKTIQDINQAVRTAREVLGLTGPKAIEASDLGAITNQGLQSLIAVYTFSPALCQKLAVGESPDLDLAARKAIDSTMTRDTLALTAFFLRKIGYGLHRDMSHAFNRIYYPELYSRFPNEAEKQESRIHTLGQCVSFIKALQENPTLPDDQVRTAALEGLLYLFEGLRDNRSDYACAQQTIKQGVSLAEAFAVHAEALSTQLIRPLGSDARKLGYFSIHPSQFPPLLSVLSGFSGPHWCQGSLCHELSTHSESSG